MPITDLETNVIADNIGKVYFLKSGVYRDPVGLDNNHPLSSVSAMLIHIEDGVPQNVMVANYAPSKMASWASHDFPLWYRGEVTYTIQGESAPRTFAQYFTYVPSILVAMNKNGVTDMTVQVTITQNTGANLLGGFADLTALNAEFPPTEELSDDVATAYVYDSGTKGFYRVAWNTGTSAWKWTLITQALVTYGVQTKQYNVLPIKVQRGYAPNQTPLTVSDEVVRLIYQEIAYVNAVIANHTELLEDFREDLDNEILNIRNLLITATENDWNYEGELPSEIRFANSRNGWVQVDNEIYVFGGADFLGTGPEFNFSNEFAKKSYKYNVVTKQLAELSDLPIAVNELRGVYKDGFIYLIGQDVSSIEELDKTYKYEISTDTYTLITNPPVRIRYSSGAVLVSNKVYVFVDEYYPGNNPSVKTNTTPYVYDIATNTWEVKTPTNLTFDRGYAYYYNGLIYVHRSLKFQAYNPTTDTWITDLTPPTYGVVHTGLMHEFRGRLFIGSGWETALAKNNPYFQYYNVAKNKWYVMSRLEVDGHALGYGSLFLYNDKFYYIGGYSNETSPVFNTIVRSFNLEKLRFENMEEIDERLATIEQDVLAIEQDIEDLQSEKEDKSNKATSWGTPNDTEYPTTKLVDDRLDPIETFKDVTVPATYETIANVDAKLLLKEDLINKVINFLVIDDVKYPSVQATETRIDSKVSAHNISGTAHADIRALISALQGSYVFRGFITVYAGTEPTPTELNNRITALLSRSPVVGDVLIDNSEIEWYFDGTNWNNMGQAIIALASAVNDGLMSKEDYAKLLALPTNATLTSLIDAKIAKSQIINDLTTGGTTDVLSAEQGKTLQTTTEKVANKKTAWQETPTDTAYPSEKLVYDTIKDIGLDTPITQLNNHSLREVFESTSLFDSLQLLSNSGNPFTVTTGYDVGTIIDGNIQYTGSLDPLIIRYNSSIPVSNGTKWYSITKMRKTDAIASYLSTALQATISGTTLTFSQQLNAVQNQWYFISGIKTSSDHVGNIQIRYYTVGTGEKTLQIAFSYLFNISTLITNKQYSPLYQTTFDLMSDANIKSTMDLFVSKPYLFIDYEYYGIDTLTVSQMDYWYGVYETIKNGSTTYGFLNTLYDLFTSKANATLESWITPTLTTATTTYLKYRKDTLGTVIIEGNLTVTTAGTNFTLPTGYRPLFAYVDGDLTFNTDGTVVSASTGLKYINVRFTGGA